MIYLNAKQTELASYLVQEAVEFGDPNPNFADALEELRLAFEGVPSDRGVDLELSPRAIEFLADDLRTHKDFVDEDDCEEIDAALETLSR